MLYRLYASSRYEEMALVDWSPEQKESFLRSQFDLQDHHYRRYFPEARFDLVLRGEDVLGRLYVVRDGGALLMLDLALFPEHRGQGHGTRLIQDVFREAAETGLNVRVHVLPQNRARSLYLRLGFRKIAEEGLHELLEWHPPATGDG